MPSAARPDFEVVVDPQIQRRLRKIPPKHQRQILGRIAELQSEPRPHDSIQLHSPLPGFRLDIGEYRILYEIDYPAREVWVYRLLQRGEGYGHLR